MPLPPVTWQRTPKSIQSFQPEVLPRLQSIAFTSNQAVSASELAAVLNKVALNADYTQRSFAASVEMNLRPVYAQHGYYGVRFAPSAPQLVKDAASVSIAIDEGASYTLGKVDIRGDCLPLAQMTSAGKLPAGKLAELETDS